MSSSDAFRFDGSSDATQLGESSGTRPVSTEPQLPSEQPSWESEPQKDAVRCYLVGTGRPMPGATQDRNAARIMEILTEEATGNHRLPRIGRADGGWCHKKFLISVSGAGQKLWKCFKTNYERRIDHSHDWQWVRVGQGQEIDPFRTEKQD